MLKAEQIPMEVQDALNKAHGFFVSPRALAAAINAWPGMEHDPGALVAETYRDPGKIILPLPTENSNAEG